MRWPKRWAMAPAIMPAACATFLTGVHIHKSDSVLLNGPSMDQIVARQFGQSTQIASMELGLDQPSMVGSCDSGYSCAYNNTLAWTGPRTPLPITVNPRDVFDRLFGDAEQLDADTRRQQLQHQASLLDLVAGDAKRLSASLGASDRLKVDEYLQSVRDVERGIQTAEDAERHRVADGWPGLPASRNPIPPMPD